MLAHNQKPHPSRGKKKPRCLKRGICVYVSKREPNQRTIIQNSHKGPPFHLFFVEYLNTIRILADVGDESLFDQIAFAASDTEKKVIE